MLSSSDLFKANFSYQLVHEGSEEKHCAIVAEVEFLMELIRDCVLDVVSRFSLSWDR